jgi:hypothetical protein
MCGQNRIARNPNSSKNSKERQEPMKASAKPQQEQRHLGATFSGVEQKLHEILVVYDSARKAEGYAIAYRRWAYYTNIADGMYNLKALTGRHVETMYLNRDNGKALLVKTQIDGGTSAFEATA